MKTLLKALVATALLAAPLAPAMAAMAATNPAMIPGTPPKGGFLPPHSSGNAMVDQCNHQASRHGMMYQARTEFMKSCLMKAMNHGKPT